MRKVHHIEYDKGNKIFVLEPKVLEKPPLIIATANLALKHQWPCGNAVDYGVVGEKCMTYAFILMVAGTLANSGTNPANIVDYKYHAVGTGSTAEAATGAGAAIVTEVYGQNHERAQGTQVVTASSPNAAYKSVGIITFDETINGICEHALYNYISGGTCMDRTLWTGGDVVDVVSGSILTVTYTSTWNSGG